MNSARLHCGSDPDHDIGAGRADYRCGACGEELVVERPESAFAELIQADRGPLWRYSALIPATYDARLDDHDQPYVVRSPALEGRLGVEAVWLLDATRLGTGNFKDYESAVVVAASADAGLDRISVHSTGNTAGAYRHYAQRVGLPCASYIPMENLDKMGCVNGEVDWPIYAIDAPYPAVSGRAKQTAAAAGWHHMAPLPWKLEGKAALAWQVAEFCDGADTIVQTVAGGYGALGMEKGFRRIEGLSDNPVVDRHRFLLFQPSDADGLGRAWRAGLHSTNVEDLRLPDDPYEPTLQSTNPVSTLPELRASLPEGSEIVSVSTADVEARRDELVALFAGEGIVVDAEREKSAVISLAGLLDARLDPSTRLVLVVSGSRPFDQPGSPSDWELVAG